MISVNGNVIEFLKFPDGTPRFKFEVLSNKHRIIWKYESMDELTLLQFIVRHIREAYLHAEISLYMPYIPNARFDRVENLDEVFTLKHFCSIINEMMFESVCVVDAHSNISLALIDRVISVGIDPDKILENMCVFDNNRVECIYFPDKGSMDRYKKYFKDFDTIAFGSKTRDWSTGEITGMSVVANKDITGMDVLIVDDICSAGGTFYYSAIELKKLGAKNIYLYVTHCENTVLDGVMIKSGLIDKIYTTDSIFTGEHELIKVIK